MLEYLQLYHELQYLIIQGYKSVLPILADGRTDEDSLVLDGNIANLYLGQLIRSDEGVILKQASQEKMLVVLIQVLLQSSQRPIGKWVSELLRLCNVANIDGRVLGDILSVHQPSPEGDKPRAIVIPGRSRDVTIIHQMVKEVDNKGSV